MSLKKRLIPCFCYLGATAFSILFSCVYYMQSNGLRDTRMTLLFLPCLIVTLIFLLLALTKISIGYIASVCFNFGFAFLWLFLCLGAIYTMAKTANSWLILFLILSLILFGASLVFIIVHFLDKKKTAK